KQVWAPKPSELRNPLDTLPAATAQVAQKKRAAPPRPQARPPPPKREVRYHCEICDREGHLEEFCFKRKWAVRREQERRNADMYSAWVHGPSRRGDRRDARTRRVGGGQGDGGAPAGGRFAGRARSRFQYGYGPRDRDFGGGFEAPHFPRGGDRQPRSRWDRGYVLPDFGYPSVEQMARHWFASHFANPSVESDLASLQSKISLADVSHELAKAKHELELVKDTPIISDVLECD